MGLVVSLALTMSQFLEEQYAFYASYHGNTLNILVHVVCVWPILWTAQMMLALVALPDSGLMASYLPPSVLAYAGPNGALIGTLIYDPKAGVLAAGLVVAGNAAANVAAAQYPPEDILKVAAMVHVGCWVAQIAAHKVFEGRAPALLDNLAQAFLMAPYFVLLEIIMHIGYEPSPG